MINFAFTTLEIVLLVWFILFAIALIGLKLTDTKELETMTVFVLFILLPLVIVFMVFYVLYDLTIGQIVKLAKERNVYKTTYNNALDTIKGLREKIEKQDKKV